MTPTARNICTRVVCATSSFNFGLPNLYCFTLLSRKKRFSKKSEAELFDWGVANDMSKVTHVCVHHVDTLFLFCSVPFALDHLEINFAWLLQRLVSLSFKKATVHITLLAEYFFLKSMFALSSLLT